MNAEIHFISQSDDVERSAGDFWSVEEHRISDLEQLIALTGTGLVEMTTVTLDNGSTQPGVRLYFDVDIKGTSHYKYTYKAITGNPEANLNEVQEDQTYPVESQDSFYLEFLIR